MWGFASNGLYRRAKLKNDLLKQNESHSECSDDDDEMSNASSGEELECPICWESFNLVENVPYVLWCGHTLCKHCVLGLPWASMKLPTSPVQLPFFITCPWCNHFSFRFVYKGTLRFPRKNFFILWMVEGMNGERSRKHTPARHTEHRQVGQQDRNRNMTTGVGETSIGGRRVSGHLAGASRVRRLIDPYFNIGSLNSSFCKSLAFVAHVTSRFPLLVIFLLVILYAIPVSAAILALYVVITFVFALPSFLVLYFAYPGLDWLIREILA